MIPSATPARSTAPTAGRQRLPEARDVILGYWGRIGRHLSPAAGCSGGRAGPGPGAVSGPVPQSAHQHVPAALPAAGAGRGRLWHPSAQGYRCADHHRTGPGGRAGGADPQRRLGLPRTVRPAALPSILATCWSCGPAGGWSPPRTGGQQDRAGTLLLPVLSRCRATTWWWRRCCRRLQGLTGLRCIAATGRRKSGAPTGRMKTRAPTHRSWAPFTAETSRRGQHPPWGAQSALPWGGGGRCPACRPGGRIP